MSTLVPPRPGPRVSPLFLGVQLLLLTLAISRYDATAFVYRWGDEVDFFNWFWRHRTLGVLSFFDFLLLALLGLVAAGIVASGRWRPRPFDALAYGLVVLVAVSAAVRFLQVGVEDTTRGFLYQLRNYAYFVAAYAAASRLRWTPQRLRWFGGLAAGLAVVTMALSWWEVRQGTLFWLRRLAPDTRYCVTVHDPPLVIASALYPLAFGLRGAASGARSACSTTLQRVEWWCARSWRARRVSSPSPKRDERRFATSCPTRRGSPGCRSWRTGDRRPWRRRGRSSCQRRFSSSASGARDEASRSSSTPSRTRSAESPGPYG